MQINREPPRLGHRGGVAARVQGLVIKALAIAGAAVVLMSAIAISLVLFAFVLAFLLTVGGYLWWKTRHVRKQMRAHFERERGEVIEGVVVREVKTGRSINAERDSHSNNRLSD